MVQTTQRMAINYEEADFPLTFRLRRSWSADDLMELRKASEEDDFEFELPRDCADSCGAAQDDVSTFDGSDEQSLAGFGSEGSIIGDWAEQMQGDSTFDMHVPMCGPPGQWAVQTLCAGNTSFPPGNFATPPGQLGGQWSGVQSSCDAAAEASTSPSEPSEPTTLLVSNLPRAFNRSMLIELLDAERLLIDCDLVYLPVEFKVGIGYGYAFVNFSSHQAACAALEVLDGLTASSEASLIEGALQACFSSKQGLNAHIELYRNSPVMHKSVDDEAKPALLRAGARLPFPEPTRRLRAPRARRALLSKEDVEAALAQGAWQEPLAE